MSWLNALALLIGWLGISLIFCLGFGFVMAVRNAARDARQMIQDEPAGRFQNGDVKSHSGPFN